MMMLPHSIITVSVITALLPRLSRQAHDKDLGAFGSELSQSLRFVTALIIPSAAFLFVCSPWIGAFLYGYGASSTEQGKALGFVASMFALGLPAFSLFYVLLRSYYAQENTKTPFIINLGFNVLHLAIGSLLFFLLPENYKVAGLALGYSISYFATCTFTWIRISRRVPDLRDIVHIRLLVRVLVASLVAAFAAFLAIEVLFGGSFYDSALKLGLEIISFGLVFSVAYIALAKLMRVTEINVLLALVKSR
jgi:putative peptidoglycan lipid II flippase